MPRRRTLVGWSAVMFSALYLLSDAIEAAQGGFSTAQLWLTLIAEAAIPPVVLGISLMQRPQLGRLGEAAAVAYAGVYVFFTATVVYALVEATPDFDALTRRLDPWMTIGGAVMVLAGVGFGVAVLRARVLPRWTGAVLALGVVLVAFAADLPESAQLLAAATRDLGLAAMGAALLLAPRSTGHRRRSTIPPPTPHTVGVGTRR